MTATFWSGDPESFVTQIVTLLAGKPQQRESALSENDRAECAAAEDQEKTLGAHRPNETQDQLRLPALSVKCGGNVLIIRKCERATGSR